MGGWTVVVLLGLTAGVACGSSGLLDALGLETDTLIEFSGIELPSVDKTGAEHTPPCGVSPSEAVTDATAACVEEVTEGNDKGKGKSRGRGRRGQINENAVQKCVFQKLSLEDEDGTPTQTEIVKLIDTYSGDSEGKQIMKRMAEKCMATIDLAPAKKKANVLMTCVKKSMRDACKVHDLKKENPFLAQLVAQKNAEKCVEGIELPSTMIWSRLRCSAEQVKKFADVRLATLAPARKRRSPKRGKGRAASKEENGPKEDLKEVESGKEENGESRAERRKKQKEQRKEMQKTDMQEAKEKLERLVGPLDELLKTAEDALLETDRCTYSAAGVLDDENMVDGDKMKMLLTEATGAPKVKDALLAAADMCLTKDSALTTFTECLNRELTVTCPAALSADRRQKKASRRGGGRGRRRQSARAGRPANVARPRIPAAALKRRP